MHPTPQQIESLKNLADRRGLEIGQNANGTRVILRPGLFPTVALKRQGAGFVEVQVQRRGYAVLFTGSVSECREWLLARPAETISRLPAREPRKAVSA